MSLITARVIVAVPTLVADEALGECLASLDGQTFRDFAVIVIDNSAQQLAARFTGYTYPLTCIANEANVGFGAAINQAIAASQGEYVATLNDDCVASPLWLEELLNVISREYEIGLCAPQVLLKAQPERIDSAGMLIALDGSSKQRGFQQPPDCYQKNVEVLLPSGSSALYRRSILEDIGGFDETFFLYCEDTDLGLRARWAGWQAFYAAKAIVYHRYSHSSSSKPEWKAFLVERNRLLTVIKNFPVRDLLMVPFASLIRYAFTLWSLMQGRGAAAHFGRQAKSPLQFPTIVWKAHWHALRHWPALRDGRRAVKRRLAPKQISTILKRHRISLYQVATL